MRPFRHSSSRVRVESELDWYEMIRIKLKKKNQNLFPGHVASLQMLDTASSSFIILGALLLLFVFNSIYVFLVWRSEVNLESVLAFDPESRI